MLLKLIVRFMAKKAWYFPLIIAIYYTVKSSVTTQKKNQLMILVKIKTTTLKNLKHYAINSVRLGKADKLK